MISQDAVAEEEKSTLQEKAAIKVDYYLSLIHI